MKKTFLRIIAVLAVLSMLCTMISVTAFATAETANETDTHIYMKIDGIEGESKDTKHEKWIDVLYFSHASLQSIQTGSPDAAGRGVFEPVCFKHVVDKATPKIQEACMKGSHIKCAELHFCRTIAGRQEVVYKVKFEGFKFVKAEVVTEKLEDGSTRLVETVHFLVNKQTWTETAVGLDNVLGGNTEACFDQTKKCLSDIDGDTYINSFDALLVLQHTVKMITLTEEQKEFADANGDNIINSIDALWILEYAVGKR